MDPLCPRLRKALKEAHPGLTDEQINEYEKLLSERFGIDPEKYPEIIRELDEKRMTLMKRVMPNYVEVCKEVQSE